MPNERFGMHVELLPEKVEDYIRFHEAVWPEVESRFEQAGFDALSVFLQGTTVFLYVEYHGEWPFEEALAWYADDPTIQKWEDMNAACKATTAGATETGFQRMSEIYRYQRP